MRMVLFRSPFGSFNLIAALFYKTRMESFTGDLIARNFFNPIKSEGLFRRNVEWRRRRVLTEQSCGINRSDIEHPF